MKTKRMDRAGVSLIELIMATVILAIVAVPMAHMIGGQMQGMIASSDLTQAGNLARNDMEVLNNLAPTYMANITSGSFSSYLGTSYNLTRNVTSTSGNYGMSLKDVTITVKRNNNSKVLATLYSSIASNVTYAP